MFICLRPPLILGFCLGDYLGHQPGQAHHQRPQQVHEVPGTGDEHFRTSIRKMVSEDGSGSWKLPLHLTAGQRSCPQQQEDAGLAQREPYRGVWVGDPWPPSSLDCNRFIWISLGVSELRANLKPHNKIQNLLPKIKEVMGSFDRNTMAKACTKLQVQDRGCLHSWR